jgi:hypothetical protein
MKFFRNWAGAAAICAALGGCATIHNEPSNLPLAGANPAILGSDAPTTSEELLVGLAFSGGGTRAAAFSYGVLTEIERTQIPLRYGNGSLLDRVDFVSGVSGGSVLAAYYGLKKRAALADFRERFLLRDAEEQLSTALNPVSIVRAFRRRERLHQLPALARREPVPGRDVRPSPQPAAAPGLDQCLRHLQPHHVCVRTGCLCRDLL